MRALCLVLLPVGVLGLVDVLLLDKPSSHGWWQHDGGVLVLQPPIRVAAIASTQLAFKLIIIFLLPCDSTGYTSNERHLNHYSS